MGLFIIVNNHPITVNTAYKTQRALKQNTRGKNVRPIHKQLRYEVKDTYRWVQSFF